MNAGFSSWGWRGYRPAFTLVEVMVSISILMVMMMLIVKLISMSSLALRQSDRTMAAIDDARFALDMIGEDLATRVRRNEVAFNIVSSQGNDSLLFYTAVPSVPPTTNDPRGIALVGYRVNESPYQLQRAAVGVSWSASGSPLPFGDPNQAQTVTVPSDDSFDSASDSIFRLEFSVIMLDGSIKAVAPSTPQDFNGRVFAIIATVAALDPVARKQLSNPDAQLKTLAGAFDDAKDGAMVAQTWIQRATNVKQLASDTGLPSSVLSSIRISTRIYYVH